MKVGQSEVEKTRVNLYCDVTLVERLDRVAKTLGFSRNQLLIWFLETSLQPVEKMESSGILKLLRAWTNRKSGKAENGIGEIA